MPSGAKKRKSAKRKNKASASPPHQGNGTKGKEKNNLEENDFSGKGEEKEKLSSQFIGGEAGTPRDMDSSENGGSMFACMDEAEITFQAEGYQKVEDMKRLALDTSAEELRKANNLEDNDTIDVGVDKSLDDVTTLLVEVSEVSVPVLEEKLEATPALEVDVSASGEEDRVILDANGSVEAPHDDEKDAITPKIEIPHPPMVVRLASVWNCCGLLEVFMDSQK